MSQLVQRSCMYVYCLPFFFFIITETGVVTGLQGRYPYIVWDAPEQCQSNGVITRYSLRFTRDGMTYVVTTASDQTFYVIEDGIVPWTSGSFDVTVSD